MDKCELNRSELRRLIRYAKALRPCGSAAYLSYTCGKVKWLVVYYADFKFHFSV
jgi:hypothetical protein